MSAGTARAVVDRSRLPEPGPSSSFVFPDIQKTAAEDGLAVWSVRHAPVPVVALAVLIRRGAADDPPGKEGLAALTLDMLDEGSAGRSAIEFHEALSRLGAQIDTDISSDACLITTTVLSRFTEDALTLIADMIARPLLTEEDFARVRTLRLHRLIQLRDMPGALADRAFVKVLYGDHPYGHTPLGVERTLSALDIDDVRAFHRSAIRPSEATVIAVGDCDHAATAGSAARAFAGWRGAASVPAPILGQLPALTPLSIVNRPGAPQSELRIGHVAAPRHTPDYHALVAANMVLGGQFVSRINLNLREDKGFTYGARTSFDFRRLPGPFVLQAAVHAQSTVRAIEESLAEITGLRGSKPVSASELSLAVAALTRGYARNFETAEQVARAVSQIALYDLPDDYFARFVPQIESVTPDDVMRVASAHLNPAELRTIVVGDRESIGDLAPLKLGDPAIISLDNL